MDNEYIDTKDPYEGKDGEKVNKDYLDWENPPRLEDLKKNYEDATVDHEQHIQDVNRWLSNMNGARKFKPKKGRSKIVPKLIRKQAEWRYAALSEPFTSTDKLFKVDPVTFEDSEGARQNELVLNYQFNHKIDKVDFIDELVRAAVDEGTAVIKLGWEFEEKEVDVEVPIYKTVFEGEAPINPINPGNVQGGPGMAPGGNMPEPQHFGGGMRRGMGQGQGQGMGQGLGQGQRRVKVGVKVEKQIKTIVNKPTLEICSYDAIKIDPTCEGKTDKAEFIIYSYETSLSALKKDGRYFNLDKINVNSGSTSDTHGMMDSEETSFEFADKPRKKFTIDEYWGFWDVDNTGEVEPILCCWVENTLVRMESSPLKKIGIPFEVIQYLPKRKKIYGEPDGELLEDNQDVIGAITRGVIDIIGRSANGQQGTRKDALDPVQARKFERGEDYKFNANIDPKQAFHMGTYPEIPRSALEMIQMNNSEAESLTGVKAFSAGISGQELGKTATGIRSALDATAKREFGILVRIANGITRVARKIMTLNSEFLEDDEIIRVTNEEFIAINRDDLEGEYDMRVNISTPEANANKSQKLSFMLQTIGNNMPPQLSNIILAKIAELEGMPDLAQVLKTYKPEPDPLAQKLQELDIEMKEAQVANETAKGRENAVDVGLKKAKTQTELSKSRRLETQSDTEDLNFLEKESGIGREKELEDKRIDQEHELNKESMKQSSDMEKEAMKQVGQMNKAQPAQTTGPTGPTEGGNTQ